MVTLATVPLKYPTNPFLPSEPHCFCPWSGPHHLSLDSICFLTSLLTSVLVGNSLHYAISFSLTCKLYPIILHLLFHGNWWSITFQPNLRHLFTICLLISCVTLSYSFHFPNTPHQCLSNSSHWHINFMIITIFMYHLYYFLHIVF